MEEGFMVIATQTGSMFVFLEGIVSRNFVLGIGKLSYRCCASAQPTPQVTGPHGNLWCLRTKHPPPCVYAPPLALG